MVRCSGITVAGNQCAKMCSPGQAYCVQHRAGGTPDPDRARSSLRYTPDPPGRRHSTGVPKRRVRPTGRRSVGKTPPVRKVPVKKYALVFTFKLSPADDAILPSVGRINMSLREHFPAGGTHVRDLVEDMRYTVIDHPYFLDQPPENVGIDFRGGGAATSAIQSDKLELTLPLSRRIGDLSLPPSATVLKYFTRGIQETAADGYQEGEEGQLLIDGEPYMLDLVKVSLKMQP